MIGGYGNVRIIDIDTKHPDYLKLAQQLHEALNSFTVETGSGGRHFYVTSAYDINHVFVGGKGEFRANNYQVVAPGCTHPNGNKYKIVNDVPIRQVSKEELLKLIQPMLRPAISTSAVESTTDTKERDDSRSGLEFAEVCKLIRKDKTKEEVFKHMQVFAKWSTAPEQYRELTFKKARQAVGEEKRRKEQQDAESIKQAVLSLQEQVIESFADEDENTWVQYVDGEKTEFYPILSQPFEDFIRTNLMTICGEPKEAWVQPILKLLDSMARRKEHRKLNLRSAEQDGAWFIQLDRQKAAKITEGDVKIIDTPLFFRNFPHQLSREADLTAAPQDIHLLRGFLNFRTEQDYQIFIATLPTYLIPGITKAIGHSKGEPGSAKTTTCRIKQAIIDPSTAMKDGIEFPKDDKDWYAIAREHSHIFLDNIGKLTPDQQDKLSRVITGTNIKKRKLYSDFTTVQANIKLSLDINAIELLDLQSDFLDRTVPYEQKRIADNQRKSDEAFNRELKACMPKIIGAILHILAQAKQIAPNIKIPQSLRLTDFAKYATASAVALGYDEDYFASLLQLKCQEQKDETISQSRIAEPILFFMENRGLYTGTAAELLKELTRQEFGKVISRDGFETVEIPKVLPDYWPKDPAAFGKEIRRIGFVLETLGVGVTFKPREGSKRPIELRQKESFGKNTVIAVTTTPFIVEKNQNDSAMTGQKTLSSAVIEGSPKQVNDRMTANDSTGGTPVITDLSSKTAEAMTVMTVNSESKKSELLAIVKEASESV